MFLFWTDLVCETNGQALLVKSRSSVARGNVSHTETLTVRLRHANEFSHGTRDMNRREGEEALVWLVQGETMTTVPCGGGGGGGGGGPAVGAVRCAAYQNQNISTSSALSKGTRGSVNSFPGQVQARSGEAKAVSNLGAASRVSLRAQSGWSGCMVGLAGMARFIRGAAHQ